MSTTPSFSNGILILVEGDKPNQMQWWIANKWQSSEFIKAMHFGTMKSMGGYPVPIEYTKPFTVNNFTYRFIIENEWGPCYLHNMTTNKKRRIKYINLGSNDINVFPDKKDNKSAEVLISKY